MTKQKIMRIILIVASVLIIIGVLLMLWMTNAPGSRGEIKVYLKDGQTQTVAFENLCLIPGNECEYTIVLKSTAAKKCDVNFDFKETQESNLKNFARVKIISDGEVVLDKLLADVFKEGKIVLNADFTNGKRDEFIVVYYLPIEVGNEAQNAEANFELNIFTQAK